MINKKMFSLFGMFWIVADFVEDVGLKSIPNLADVTQTETVLVWKREINYHLKNVLFQIIHFSGLRREQKATTISTFYTTITTKIIFPVEIKVYAKLHYITCAWLTRFSYNGPGRVTSKILNLI